jgi:hypothetical protein
MFCLRHAATGTQSVLASAEDRALRGRNPSAALKPDERPVGLPQGGPASPGRYQFQCAKSTFLLSWAR